MVQLVVGAASRPRRQHASDIDLAHGGMQPFECVCILGEHDLSWRHRFVVGPQRDHEAVTHVDARVHSMLKRSHRAFGFRESLSKLDFELCARLIDDVRDPSDDVTRQQVQNELVRILKHDRVIDE